MTFRKPDMDSAPRAPMNGSRVRLTFQGREVVARIVSRTLSDLVIELHDGSTGRVSYGDVTVLSPWET